MGATSSRFRCLTSEGARVAYYDVDTAALRAAAARHRQVSPSNVNSQHADTAEADEGTVEYFTDVFTPKTWHAFLQSGAAVTAFSGGAMKHRAAKVEVGDRFLCYLAGKFSWVGALEATSRAYEDESPIWNDSPFPVRVDVKPIVALQQDEAKPLIDFEGKLSIFPQGLRVSYVPASFQGSPRRMPFADGDVVFKALLAHEDGVLATRRVPSPVPESTSEPEGNQPGHTEIQALLSRFGLSTGCQVWIPRADRMAVGRIVPSFDLEALLPALPLLFGGRAQSTIENIDVLWLRDNSVAAAFEVEHTTSVYSGLLRLSDLVASFPNVRFPMFIVAPRSRRSKVRDEIMRPTFARFQPPLSTACGFIAYEELVGMLERFGEGAAKYINPEIVRSIAEYFHD